MVPILEHFTSDGTPWHSSPTQALPPYFVQTSSLEIAWTKTVYDTGTISGYRVVPFLHELPEGLALDTDADWREAERLLAAHEATLPAMDVARLSPTLTQK